MKRFRQSLIMREAHIVSEGDMTFFSLPAYTHSSSRGKRFVNESKAGITDVTRWHIAAQVESWAKNVATLLSHIAESVSSLCSMYMSTEHIDITFSKCLGRLHAFSPIITGRSKLAQVLSSRRPLCSKRLTLRVSSDVRKIHSKAPQNVSVW